MKSNPKNSDIKYFSELKDNFDDKICEIGHNEGQKSVNEKSFTHSELFQSKDIHYITKKNTWIANNEEYSAWLELVVFHFCSNAQLHVNDISDEHDTKTEVNTIEVVLVKGGVFDYGHQRNNDKADMK